MDGTNIYNTVRKVSVMCDDDAWRDYPPPVIQHRAHTCVLLRGPAPLQLIPSRDVIAEDFFFSCDGAFIFSRNCCE